MPFRLKRERIFLAKNAMFENRIQAGQLLSEKLEEYRDKKDTVVVALPRGGVVVGACIARNLNLPLDVIAVKKLGAPNNPELAIGAVAQNKAKYIDLGTVVSLGVTREYLKSEMVSKYKEVEDRIKKYHILTENLQKFTYFLLTDDGVATGATIRAALNVIKELKLPAVKPVIILAVPVAAKEIYNQLNTETDKIEVIEVADDFSAVGQFYKEFNQVNDNEVINLLNKYRQYS